MNVISNSLLFVIYAFSLPHHLRTFFSPFKRVVVKSTSPGINLSELSEVISYNLVSIGIGIILRTIVILAGLVSLLVVSLLSPVILIFQIVFSSLRKMALPWDKEAEEKFIRQKIASDQENLLDKQDFDRIKLWYQNRQDHRPVTKILGIGADWSYGYTNELDKFQVSQATSAFPRVVGRDKEVKAIEEVLAKTTQNSVIVSGEPGVGRHAVVDELSRRLFAGTTRPELIGLRTIYLDLESAISTGALPLDLFEEGHQAGNIILIIDDFDKFLDLTSVFNQTLAEGKLRVIGITSQQATEQQVLQNSSLLKLFSIITVEPPDIETVFLETGLSIVPVLEKEHKIIISYQAIKKTIGDADRFISTIPFPEKAIDILDEAISFVKSDHPHMTTLLAADVDRYLSTKTKIPLGTLSGTEKEKLAHLEENLHERIVGQNEAVSAVSKAMRRAVLDVSARNKPIGTFLFLGPTGVGKTETAKALAEIYFGSETRLVRFDMSEFQGEVGLERILDQLPKALVNNPFAVVLLDEIEKTPPLISNLFLTLLDEGYITNTAKRKVMARENIIIGTSNAPEKTFSPEMLNRFDGIIHFQTLDEAQIKEVAKKLLAGVAARLEDKKITLEFSPELIEKIIKEGYDSKFGARSVRRYIQDTVEDQISQKLLSGDFPPGSTLKI